MSYLSQEDIDAKIAEAMSDASILSQPSKRKADALDDEIDSDSVTGDEFLGNYDKYELEFIDDEYTPYSKSTKKSVAAKRSRNNPATSTVTSATATATTSTAKPAKKTKHLKKDIELPVKIDLIELVKKERCLYNLKDKMYMSRVHKQMVWEKISTTLKKHYAHMNVEKCKKMWNAVRESTR